MQTIYLSGFKCVKLRPDSFLNGTSSNEIFFVLAINAPESGGLHGSSVGTFRGVKAGFGRKTRNSVWSGVQQPLSLRVAMFEQDAGKNANKVATQVMITALSAAVGRAANGGGDRANTSSRVVNNARNAERPNRSGAVLQEDGQVEVDFLSRMGRGFSNALGLSDDYLGYGRQTFGRGDWSSRPTYSERDIRYHFHTDHRANGANCRAYFLIERGPEVKQPVSSEPELGPYDDPYGDPYSIPVPYNGAGSPPDGEPLSMPPLIYDPLPPPPEPDWFRVRFKNSCDVPISLSYAYKNPSRGWIKRGWANFDPGESGAMEGNTLTPEIYVYTSQGRVAGSFDPDVIELAVRKNGFDTDRATSFRGDTGARMVPYSLHVLSDISGTELIAVRDCDEWIAGELSSTQKPTRVPVVLPYTLGETHNRVEAPRKVESNPVAPAPATPQAPEPQPPLDLSGLDERCRLLVAGRVMSADECRAPN